jgi:tRNA pseudouridine55 synthase
VKAERLPRRAVDGVLLLDKPHGWTSHQAVQAVKRWYRAERAGHTGTLDPLATGLLALCLGEATKFASGWLDADKTYVADIELGAATTTGDAEGEVRDRRPVTADIDAVQAALARFRGAIEQVPPMFAALKRNGKPLYELARQGIEVERSPRAVVIHELELERYERPHLRVRVRCSKGTYVRTLAEDIGRALGCGAHLSGLRRTAIASMLLEQAASAAQLDAATLAERDRLLLPADALLVGLAPVSLDEQAAAAFNQGRVVAIEAGLTGRLRAYGPGGAFLGLGESLEPGSLQPRRVLKTPRVVARASD